MTEETENNVEGKNLVFLISAFNRNNPQQQKYYAKEIIDNISNYDYLLEYPWTIESIILSANYAFEQSKDNHVYHIVANILENATIHGVKLARPNEKFFDNITKNIKNINLLNIKEIIDNNNKVLASENYNNELTLEYKKQIQEEIKLKQIQRLFQEEKKKEKGCRI